MSDDQQELELDNQFRCLYDISLGVHYHMRRQKFFESWHRMTGVFSLIFSTSAVATITNQVEIGTLLAALVAVLQSIDLMVDTRGKSLTHNELRQKYLALNAKLISFGEQVTVKQKQNLFKEKNAIEITEPPVNRLLLEVCHNDVLDVLGGQDADKIKIPWVKKNTVNFIPWDTCKPENKGVNSDV